MKIKNISFLNIDDLYQIVFDKENDENYKMKQFGKNLPQLYNHIAITYELEEITSVEYIYLKMLSSSITKLIYSKDNDKFLEENYPEIYGNVLSYYMEYMNNEEIIGYQKRYFSPMCTLIGSCSVTFTGVQLISLIGLDPRDFFIKTSSRQCVDEGDDNTYATLKYDFINSIYDNEEFKNGCIKLLYTNLFKFMINKISYVDLPSDSFVKSKFTKENGNNQNVVLSTIRNPYFNIDFVNDNSNDTILTLSNYKLKNIDSLITTNDTLLEFTISSSIGEFFELFQIIPYEKFISMDSFMIPMKLSLEIIEDEKILSTTQDYINFLSNKINTIYSDDSSLLKRMELTKFNTIFNYSLLLSFDDINKLNRVFKCQEGDFIDKATYVLIEKITSMALSIYNMIS